MLLDALARVEDRGVVAATERPADFLQGRVGEFAGEVDGYLAGPAHARRATRRGEVPLGDAVVVSYLVLDGRDRQVAGSAAGMDLVEDSLGKAYVDRKLGE